MAKAPLSKLRGVSVFDTGQESASALDAFPWDLAACSIFEISEPGISTMFPESILILNLLWETDDLMLSRLTALDMLSICLE